MSDSRVYLGIAASIVMVTAAGLTPAKAQSVQVITPAPVQTQPQVIIAPNAPPPPRAETVPPPPSEEARVMYWRPGHWMWDGANWVWAPGQYVERPSAQAVWQPGHWMQEPGGGYVWIDGHWQG